MKKFILFLVFLSLVVFFFSFRKCSSAIALNPVHPLCVDTFVLGNDSFLVFQKHVYAGNSISVVPFSSFK